MKRHLLLRALACALALMGGLVPAAGAHAFLDHALPRVGSTIKASPPQLKIWFSQRLEPAFSRVQVFDSSGKRVDNGDSRVDSSDDTLLTASLPQLAPGTYRVAWRVLSVDTHVTEGDFSFDVVP
jgi:methionine-rich copper-binding protein CopC